MNICTAMNNKSHASIHTDLLTSNIILNHLSIVTASHDLNGLHELGVEDGLLGLAVFGVPMLQER